MYDAKNHIGRYTGDELEKLRILRDQFGTDWAKIGAEMGRSAASVKDRCRLLKVCTVRPRYNGSPYLTVNILEFFRLLF